MDEQDRKLGMDRAITRRDFINGVAVATASGLLAGASPAGARSSAAVNAGNYPPLRGGLRGSHPGSFEAAHQLVWEGRSDWGRVEAAETRVYDLVVVGAGISGLASAYVFGRQHPGARVLVLDNHDDFGGHAKRNEFAINGRTVLGYGGSQALQEPGLYSESSKRILAELGVDPARFDTAYDHGFLRRHGLGGATFFDEPHFGTNRLVPFSLMDYTWFVPYVASPLSAKEAVRQMPLGDDARRQLLMLLEANGDRLRGIPAAEQQAYLSGISYRDFLERHLGVGDAQLLAVLQGLTCDEAASIEVVPALDLMSYVGLPGLKATALADMNSTLQPYIHHFPDGNASIARLLVRKMIPRVAPGSTMDDVVLAAFDYSRLDDSGSDVRIRLNSTVVRVVHNGDPRTAKDLAVTYVRDGQAFGVTARSCVMAGYNAMVPHICPELPERQHAALAQAVKCPIVYTSVLLGNWRAWKKLGIGFFCAPGSYHAVSMLDFPVSMGGYQFSRSPDEPIIVHMERFPKGDDMNASPREQHKAGRRELYATSFEDIERATRRQLADALAGGGFDPASDIAAITVNRWGHGYANGYYPGFDPDYQAGEFPHEVGRARLGRITIANSDAGASATLDTALDQAQRAVDELRGVWDR
jgi:spermidine dehydrogenase